MTDATAADPAQGQAAPAPSRAGRNLPAAIGSGLVLGALVVATLFVRKEGFLVLAIVSVSIGVWELVTAFGKGGIHVPLVPSVVGTVSMMTAAYVGGPQALAVTFALTCVAVLVWRRADGVQGAARDVSGGMLVAAYPSMLAGFSALLLAPADGSWRGFVFVLVTVCSDVGGYAVGVTFGKHPMAPSISPKKSWEGFAGSVLLCVASGIVSVVLIFHRQWWVGLLLGLAVAVSATIGDLVESLIKRDLGIKDMSDVIPGHGGLMDRLDSLLVTAPVVWAILTVFAPLPGG
ncbi:MAG TPA: phosphatidate cytidylyltransferase [Candidatus Lustribacter sp.]|nr:phosphatidate cytidylyltransferase [Candidatus Lustribacter sp.]